MGDYRSCASRAARQITATIEHDGLKDSWWDRNFGTLRAARQAGGLDVMVSLARSHGVPLAASCLVTYQDRDGDLPLGKLAAELADGASLVEIAGRQAVRHRSADSEATRLDYIVPVPGRAGLLTLSFATSAEPLADALVNLFDAIAGSLRWQP